MQGTRGRGQVLSNPAKSAMLLRWGRVSTYICVSFCRDYRDNFDWVNALTLKSRVKLKFNQYFQLFFDISRDFYFHKHLLPLVEG